MTGLQRELKKHIARNITVGKVICRADETVELRMGYFYRHGRTATLWGEEVAAGLPDNWEVIRTCDEWRAWPRDSYFVAIVAQRRET